MADENLPMIGEIRMFGGNFNPPGWLPCDGRLLAIRDNEALFEVIGNTYGGDGRSTLALPDLRGRVPMGVGAGPGLTNRQMGQEIGDESVVLAVSQLPAHDHTLRGSNNSANQTVPAGNVLAQDPTDPQYYNGSASVNMRADSIGATGSNDAHSNVQPSTVLRFIIAVAGRNPRDEVRVLRGVMD
jgi:microcystin-dependent protein